jgi:hypothetical protein
MSVSHARVHDIVIADAGPVRLFRACQLRLATDAMVDAPDSMCIRPAGRPPLNWRLGPQAGASGMTGDHRQSLISGMSSPCSRI